MNTYVVGILLFCAVCVCTQDMDIVFVYTPTKLWIHYDDFTNTVVNVHGLKNWTVDTYMRTSWEREYTHVVLVLNSVEFSITALPNKLRLFCNATLFSCGHSFDYTQIGCFLQEDILLHNNRHVPEQFMLMEQTQLLFPNKTR